MSQQPENSLHRKLTEVMAAVDWQPKTERNQQQNYAFVSVERIKDAVRTQLAERHVMVYTSIKAVDRAEFTTSKGTAMLHVTVHGEVTFADGDSGEMFTIEAAGEAMDTGDKALNKAQTALVKYALINTFLIPTGDDPDHESPEVTQRRQDAPQAARTAQERSLRSVPAPDAPALTDDDWNGLVEAPRQAALPMGGPGLNSRDFFDRIDKAGIERKDATNVAKRMFGQNKWKILDLTDAERAALWDELDTSVPA